MTDVQVRKQDTADDLQARLRGLLIREGDAAYDETRKVYNAMIDKRPALIAMCADVDDVMCAVDFAANNT